VFINEAAYGEKAFALKPHPATTLAHSGQLRQRRDRPLLRPGLASQALLRLMRTAVIDHPSSTFAAIAEINKVPFSKLAGISSLLPTGRSSQKRNRTTLSCLLDKTIPALRR